MSEHCAGCSNLRRFRIVEDVICGLICHCDRFAALYMQFGIFVRDK
jgi:hypothetical protein